MLGNPTTTPTRPTTATSLPSTPTQTTTGTSQPTITSVGTTISTTTTGGPSSLTYYVLIFLDEKFSDIWNCLYFLMLRWLMSRWYGNRKLAADGG